MADHEEWGPILLERSKFFGAVFLCIVMDIAFLIAWIALHWVLDIFQRWFAPTGFESITTTILRLLLEIPPLVIIVIFIVQDMKKVVLRIVHGVTEDLSGKKP
jgi:hypothetical protein